MEEQDMSAFEAIIRRRLAMLERDYAQVQSKIARRRALLATGPDAEPVKHSLHLLLTTRAELERRRAQLQAQLQGRIKASRVRRRSA